MFLQRMTGLSGEVTVGSEKGPGAELVVQEGFIKRVHEVDPLECPGCGGAMKIISFIERRQTDVIQRILRHCGLWQGFLRTHASPRAPPAVQQPLPTAPREFELVSDGEFFEVQFPETQAEASRELQLVLDPEFL